MTRQQAEGLIDQYLQESKRVHSKRILSLETGTEPVKSYITTLIFKMKIDFKIFILKTRRYFTWEMIRKAVKEKHPYYLSRHYYTYHTKEKLFTIKPYRFLAAIEEAVLSFKKGDENYKIMLENDKKSKKYKRNLYLTMLDRFTYINIFVMKKTIEITEKITKKKIEYLLSDEAKRKDILDG